MNKITKVTTNRYVISSIVTFLAGLAVFLLSEWDSITLQSFQDGSVLGVLFVAVRAGVKALLESLLTRVVK